MRTEEGPERALGASPLNRRGGEERPAGLGEGCVCRRSGPFGAAGCAMRERGQSEDRPFQERPYNGQESGQQSPPPIPSRKMGKGGVSGPQWGRNHSSLCLSPPS